MTSKNKMAFVQAASTITTFACLVVVVVVVVCAYVCMHACGQNSSSFIQAYVLFDWIMDIYFFSFIQAYVQFAWIMNIKYHVIIPVVVDFPTPPLPDATHMMFCTPSIGRCFGRPRAIICLWWSVWELLLALTPWRKIIKASWQLSNNTRY